MNEIIEYYGSETKSEQLWCLEEVGVPNSCIFEARDECFGYYENIQGLSRPKMIFIMGNRKYSIEEITRMTVKVKKEFPFTFEAAYCEVTFGERQGSGIRLKGIDDYSVVKNIQLSYKNNGLELKKKEPGIKNISGVIKVKKFMKLQSVDPEMYMDAEAENTGYFVVDEDCSWERFATVVERVKSNWSDVCFDASKCHIYKNSSIIDLVKIFSANVNQSYLEKVKLAFMKAAAY